jgi:hypothetical protein
MFLEVVLAKPTTSSLKILIYIGSIIVIICFLRALWTVLYVSKAVVASSQRCLAALICAAVLSPSIAAGDRPGKVGLTQAFNVEFPS